MRKLLAVFLTLALAFSLCACGGSSEATVLQALDEKVNELNTEDNGMSFSREYEESSKTYTVTFVVDGSGTGYSGAALSAYCNLTEQQSGLAESIYNDIKSVMSGNKIKLVVILKYTGANKGKEDRISS